MSLSAILTGLTDRLLTVDGLTVTRFLPQQPSPPHAAIGVPDVSEYRSTMNRGYWTPTPTITVFTSVADSEYGQEQLIAFAEPVGPSSLIQAIELDRTLGGTVADCVVQSFESQGLQSIGSIECYVGTFQLICVATGG